MPVSKAQQKAVSKYMKENYDELKARIPKGQKETIKAHAEGQGESLNAFINRAITQTMERDTAAGTELVFGKKEVGRECLLRYADGEPKHYFSPDKDYLAGGQCSRCSVGRYSGSSQYARCLAVFAGNHERAINFCVLVQAERIHCQK